MLFDWKGEQSILILYKLAFLFFFLAVKGGGGGGGGGGVGRRGVIKTTDFTNPPTSYPLIQNVQNMFCILKFLKT